MDLRHRAQEGIAQVLARQQGRHDQAVGQPGRHVLHGMHGEVDLTGEQRLLDLLGEQPLAADLGQRPVADAVSGGGDDDDLDVLVGRAHGRPSGGSRLIRLVEGEGRTTGTNLQLRHLQVCSGGCYRVGRLS